MRGRPSPSTSAWRSSTIWIAPTCARTLFLRASKGYPESDVEAVASRPRALIPYHPNRPRANVISARDILAVTPFGRPDPSLAAAVCRAGALGAVDLGSDVESGLAALDRAAREAPGKLGVRVHRGAVPDPGDLPDRVDFVVMPAGEDLAPWDGFTTYVRATTLEEARRAEDDGADAVIVSGREAGGRHGEQGGFVLLQRALERLEVPVWIHGGVGLRSAAACMAGGAAGLVLDSQLALVEESTVPEEIRAAVARMDGTETVSVAGFRVYDRPDLGVEDRFRDADPDELARRLGGDDLTDQLLPVGQDGAMAAELAEHFETAAGVISALEDAVRDGIRTARSHQPLAPGSPLAEEMGTDYPILQGPMTRVSDRAAFADAVASAGALPLLALSTLEGERLQGLLEETGERLGARPWGVGILGFAPSELRAEQLEAVKRLGPPFALIAGGRPSQARAFEDEGIRTFLHVPSEGLLDLFLREGATRFVFEGRECGGHVGPLSSLVLWDRQVRRLLEHDRPEELSVVFAGGIHDERSAAMISTLAAPLAAAGARVGVLMGTAYLFTEEAVETGAIVPGYQETVRRCEDTVLLETSPGHATRCARSEYTDFFGDVRERLESEGLEAEERWIKLEQLNLGRLRIASKGIEREGDELVDVDAETQREKGMYMVGDLATMRSETTTMEELHRRVSEGWREVLPEAGIVRVEGGDGDPLDVAIVGMACVFPGARSLEEYWYNIVHGVDAIREVPPERWDPEIYFDPDGEPGETTPSKWGGFLDPIPFDPARYGIPPRSLASIDPIQLLSLEVTARALEDAGYADGEFDRERTMVLFGAEGGTDLSKAYGFRALYRQYVGELPDELEEYLPTPTEDSFPGVLTNVISGRIANRLDLGGENFTVNAACASSLASLSVACQRLRDGAADMALVGGADVHNSVGDFLMFSSVHALSESGRCRTFDRDADGITLGEGVGVVVLKRLADAEADGDRIYAVLRGVGGSSDGKSLGLTAPRPEGQVRAYRRAYREAGISPAEVGLMEAHGTGTVVGDRTELETLDALMSGTGAPPGSCALGSVKSQIGHTKGAAGIASLIKTSLALHHRVLPPTINVRRPNPAWDPETSPFTISVDPRPWLDDHRIAGVSAFGFGGTNFHAVVEEHPETPSPAAAHERWPAELFLFRGDDRHQALGRAERVLDLLEGRGPAPELRDLARTVAAEEGPVQIAVVADGEDTLRDRIDRARRGEADEDGVFLRHEPLASGGRVAFLFPGQGSQYPGMLRELFVAFPELRDLLEHDHDVARLMHPPTAFTPAEGSAQEERLKATDVAQVALGMADLALARVMDALSLRPDMRAGHSYGEMVALCRAGVWSEAALLRLSRIRAVEILSAAGDDPGAMVAANAGAHDLEELLAGLDRLVPANQNAPDQTILSGPTDQVEEAARRLENASIRSSRLPVACAFHSDVVAGARDPFRAALEETATRRPEGEVWSNTTAGPYPEDPDALRDLLADQLARPVRFADQIEGLYDAGARVFVEVGPGRVLSGLVDRVLGDRPHAAVPLDAKGNSSLVRLLRGLGRLAAQGVAFDPEPLFRGRGAETVDLDDPATRDHPALTWMVNGHYARPLDGELPDAALKPVPEEPPVAEPATEPGRRPAGAVGGDGGAEGSAAPGGADQVVAQYLRNLRELAESQRQVMLEYLGADGRSRPPAAEDRTEVPAGPDRAERGRGAPGRSAAPEAGGAGPPATDEAGGSGEGLAEGRPEGEEQSQEELPLDEMLLSIVADHTGYPEEMLDEDLDLEADLSIDSIKRIEILGVLDQRLGLSEELGDERDELLEELASLKTLGEIREWIEARPEVGGGPPGGAAGSGAPDAAKESDGAAVAAEMKGAGNGAGARSNGSGDGDAATGLERFRLEVRPAPPSGRDRLDVDGVTFALTDDGRGVAPVLAERLKERGASVRILEEGDSPAGVDGLVHLAPLAGEGGPEAVKELFSLTRSAVAGEHPEDRPRWVVAVTGFGGTLDADDDASASDPSGVAGFLRSLDKEWTDGVVRAVDVEPSEDPEVVAGFVLDELAGGGDAVEVGYADGERRTTAVVEAPLSSDDRGEELELDEDAVVLVTGGARGITSHVSVELARRYGCRLELVGRSPLPDEEEPDEVAGVEDPTELRRRLVQVHPRAEPAEIEERARRILADREIRSTIGRIRDEGGRVHYHSVDVRDVDRFSGLIEAIYGERGRLDGVIHGAGALRDRLLEDKSRDAFDQVFDTKVVSALTLERTLGEDTRFVVFFSSVAGVYGNRGQTDYAAANEFLDKLAVRLNRRIRGRAVSVAWGPWDETGMMTPELRREYGRRGIGLIPPGEGVRTLLEELSFGEADETNVIIMSAAGSERR